MVGTKFKEFVTESARVLRVTKKPTKDEFWTIAKVSGIGILIIGLLGFVLHMIDALTSIIIAAVVVIALVLFLLFMKK